MPDLNIVRRRIHQTTLDADRLEDLAVAILVGLLALMASVALW
jgi:hypothetical protein